MLQRTPVVKQVYPYVKQVTDFLVGTEQGKRQFKRVVAVPGDTIEVEREDGAVAVFAVDRGVTYGKDEFPTDEVYGDTDVPELRLITCDGYNAFTREFEENHIVYATLVDVY